ncbi:MAG: hypothetical protein Q8R24_03685 [Legionellaceae bacterium]|nr:hypothetical protein [Legionellaceae bacterium]
MKKSTYTIGWKKHMACGVLAFVIAAPVTTLYADAAKPKVGETSSPNERGIKQCCCNHDPCTSVSYVCCSQRDE